MGRGKYTEHWIATLAKNGSLKGTPGKHLAVGCTIAQMCFDHEQPQYGDYGTVPAKWECQASIKRCQVFAPRKSPEEAVLP